MNRKEARFQEKQKRYKGPKRLEPAMKKSPSLASRQHVRKQKKLANRYRFYYNKEKHDV